MKEIYYHNHAILETINGRYRIINLATMHEWMFRRDSVESAKAAIDDYLAKAI